MKTYDDFLEYIEPLMKYFINNSRNKDNYWELQHVFTGKTLQLITNVDGMISNAEFYRSLADFILECGIESGKMLQKKIFKNQIQDFFHI